MIKRVRVSNFKCIKKQTLDDITPIVGIWGRNGSGKSSLLQAIVLVLKNGGQLNRGGISLGSAQDVMFGHDATEYTCSVEVFLSGEDKYQCKIVRGDLQGGRSYDRIRYFPPWRHISGRSGRIDEQINSDLGIIGPRIHTFIHHYFHNCTCLANHKITQIFTRKYEDVKHKM